jgi:anti-sigma regulatory factor (Ser/Thr protein kinase)
VSSLPAGAEPTEQTRVLPVPDASHIGEARRAVGALSSRLNLDENAAGRVAVVATELATNIAKHGGGGHLLVRAIAGGTGIELIAVDRGRGIADVAEAMRDGYSSGGTAGHGLGAIGRMSDLFDIYSQPGHGTAMVSRMLQLRPEPVAADASDALDIGAVCVAAPNERVSGDAWVVVEGERGPSIAVIDGLGHGVAAHEASSLGIEICRRHTGAGPQTIMEAMHAGLRATRGAAAAVAEIDLTGRTLRLSGLGNISCSVLTSEGSKSLASMSGIVGHEGRRFQEFSAPFPPGATLVMFSDGILSRWRLDQYTGLRPRHPALAAGVVFRDHLRGRDDATIVVARPRRREVDGE